jgi:glycosyltransferase involved in cell wall biosynthesis
VARARPKIALIVNALGAGGLERQALTLARHLHSDHGIDAELIHLKDQGPLVADSSSLPGSTWSPGFSSGLDLRGIWRLGTRLQQGSFSSAIASNQYATLMAVLARRMRRVPVALYSGFHSVPEHIGPGVRSRTMLYLYDRCLSVCNGLVYVSHRQQQQWGQLGLGRRVQSSVIPNGIDPSRYWPPVGANIRQEFGWAPSDFVVGLCAALRPEKRGEDLVTAVSIALQRGVPLRLLIIGDGPRREQIATQIEQTLPSGVARMVGFQPDVVPFIHACDTMALVSDAEAFSIAILEAMACGKPVVATDVGGAAEQIESGRHGYVVPVRSPEAVAERLERMWRRGEAPALGDAARLRLVHEFSVQAMTSRYVELLVPTAKGAAPLPVAIPRSA